MTPTPQWYEADGDDADRHPENAQEGTSEPRMAVAGTPGPPDDCEALTGLLRLRTEALGRVQRERVELAAEVERAEAAWESWQDRCATAEAEVERLREWRKRILDEGFGCDDAEDSAAEVLEWAPTWRAQRIGAEYRLEAAEADNARLREFAAWLISMDDPDSEDGKEARRTVTLTRIIDRARAALSAPAADQPAEGYCTCFGWTEPARDCGIAAHRSAAEGGA